MSKTIRGIPARRIGAGEHGHPWAPCFFPCRPVEFDMLYDQNPVHRKLINPWYDSRTVCLAVILFMLLIFLFALVGVHLAWENTVYREMVWLPVLLAFLSGAVMLSTTVRLIKRWKHRYVRDWEYW
ncbi:MAG: hypothetical protein WAM61_07180 [Desulfobacterales bacterium]